MSTGARSERIRLLLKRVSGNNNSQEIEIDDEAVDLVDTLMSRFLDRTLESGRESAQAERRNAGEIRICDLRAYTQDTMGLDVLGFSVESLVDESGVGSRYSLVGLKKKPTAAATTATTQAQSKAHADRLALKQSAVNAQLAAQLFAKNAAKRKKKRLRETPTPSSGGQANVVVATGPLGSTE